MTRAVIYPSKTEPVLAESERAGNPQPFQWFYPLSEPVLPLAPINVAPSLFFVGEPDDFFPESISDSPIVGTVFSSSPGRIG